MTDAVVVWAGKRLTAEEEAAARRVIALVRRSGNAVEAARLERFLPKNDDRWTVDELERGAHLGPWTGFEAGVDD